MITFAAQASGVGGRTGAVTQGLQRWTSLQECSVFRRRGDAWRLHAIERSPRSDWCLRAENRVAGMTEAELRNA